MAEISDETLELIERRLSEQVSQRVRGSLFKFYAAIGAVVGAILAYVGLNIVDTIVKDAHETVTQLVDNQVAPVMEDAKKQIEDVKIQLGVIAELNQRAQDSFDDLDKQLLSFRPKAKELDEFSARLTELVEQSRKFEADSQQATDFVKSLPEVSAKLAELAQQVASLSDVVAKNQPTQAATKDAQQIAGVTQSLATASGAVSRRLSSINERTRVFFQFNAMPREQARDIAEHLRAEGFIVPGEERVQMNASGLSEIRYFWEEDKEKAEQLLAAAGDVLNKAGVQARPLEIKPRVDWTKEKPRQGTVELWIGLPISASAE